MNTDNKYKVTNNSRLRNCSLILDCYYLISLNINRYNPFAMNSPFKWRQSIIKTNNKLTFFGLV